MYWLTIELENFTFSKLVFCCGQRLVRAVLGSVLPAGRCHQGPSDGGEVRVVVVLVESP
jgi:hypothetical protein